MAIYVVVICGYLMSLTCCFNSKKNSMKLRYYVLWLLAFIWLTFFNFSSAAIWSDEPIVRQFWTFWYNPKAQSYYVAVLNSWLPLTNALGYTKNMFLYEDGVFWWFGYRGIPYWWLWDGNEFQGYIDSYKVCSEIVCVNDSCSWVGSNCSSVSVSNWTASIFRTFFSKITNDDYYAFWSNWADFGSSRNFCFSSSEVGNSLCMTISQWAWCNWTCWLTGSLWYSWVSFDSFENYWGDNSPWWASSSGSGSSSIGSWVISVPDVSTSNVNNWAVYRALLSQGYYTWLCYSDFDIVDNATSNVSGYIFNQFFTWFSLFAWQGYWWADFLDLASDSNLSKNSFFTMYSNLRKYSYQNSVLSSFDGKPKWLWRLFYKINYPSTDLKLSVSDYITFCTMTINGFSSDSNFVWDISDDTADKVVEILDKDEKFILTPDNPLWSSWTFEGEKDWFDMFKTLHNKVLNWVEVVNDDSTWTLPNYIIVAFMVAIFYYILKR